MLPDAKQRKILAACPLFEGLDPRDLLSRVESTTVRLSAGQYLFMEGDVVDRVFVLLEGTLHGGILDEAGREFLYQQLHPSYLAGGEIVCTPRKTAPYHIYATEDSLLWSCSWKDLHRDTLPVSLRLQLQENLLSFVSNQNIRKYYKIEALSMRSTRQRILKYLKAQALRCGSREFTIPMDRQAMADYLCVNRSVLSHELKKLEAEGILTVRKNHFTLLKP